MQFFKYEGLALCEAWSQENDSRRAMHDGSMRIEQNGGITNASY